MDRPRVPAPRGRRPAGADTRRQIVAAARAEFAERGLAGASLRSIARRAGVDPGTVRHHFGGLGALFAAAASPSGEGPETVLREITRDGLDGLAERLLSTVLSVWDPPEGRKRLRMLVGGLATGEPHAGAFRSLLETAILGQVAAVIPEPGARERAGLAVTQIVGLLMARIVVGLEPFASLPRERLVAMAAPTLQHLLAEPSALHDPRPKV